MTPEQQREHENYIRRAEYLIERDYPNLPSYSVGELAEILRKIDSNK